MNTMVATIPAEHRLEEDTLVVTVADNLAKVHEERIDRRGKSTRIISETSLPVGVERYRYAPRRQWL
jgi:hypothetical protein